MNRITATSSPNIALIKYWGNRNDSLRLPAADSLSMVLDTPTVEITIEAAEAFSIRSFDATGNEKLQSAESVARLEKHWKLVHEYLHTIGRAEGMPKNVSVVIRSGIPPAIGIASSAAVFSCLAEAYAGLLEGNPLDRKDVSILGRLGSGSGARNSYGGYVALENHGEGIGSAYGRQIVDEKHWVLHDIVVVPSVYEKKVGSTEGHAKASTSPLFAKRIHEIPARMKECTDALLQKDFEKLQRVSELDSLDMHEVMESQTPPLQYLSSETHRIIRDITSIRSTEKLNVLFTMDAGPTVHLICTEDSVRTVTEYAEKQKNCLVFKAKVGGSSKIIT